MSSCRFLNSTKRPALVRSLRGCPPRVRESIRLEPMTVQSIRGFQQFDSRFEITHEESLFEMLKSETFEKLVVKECTADAGTKWKFAEMLFQPVPWSPETRKGMPQEFEVYLEDPDYMIINIPPTVMFKAKIFDPSRLCAIFKKESA